ncbi:MAG: hypothetical protein RMJ19_11820 [Gemmatales bacterium]|nr:hypothetical protein [Gemmatales bacterium]MCS7161149.1 hypothetical protein [Gemmatales bacterium]MDW8176352.1 hypothetical protein [Gemmatales bacterium]MDW8221704.1 hypothetical protein [Gemmatales bacterium]
MRSASEAVGQEPGRPQASQVVAETAAPLSNRVTEVLRGLFWIAFGVAGHAMVALLGLLMAVVIILSPILVLGGIIELITWLLP